MSSGEVGDQAMSDAVAGVDIRSLREALQDDVAMANLWSWANPSGVGAAVRPGNTAGISQDPKCFGFSLGTTSNVVANLGTVSSYGQTRQLGVPPSDSLGHVTHGCTQRPWNIRSSGGPHHGRSHHRLLLTNIYFRQHR